MANMIPVIEYFGPTIQGEGSVCGHRTMFIRLGGCDFKCAMCDSMHAVDPKLIEANAEYLDMARLTKLMLDLTEECQTLTISGGNPAIWDIGMAVEELRNHGRKTCVETQGTIWRDWLGTVNILTVSPKSPGMGERFEPEVFKAFMDKARIASAHTSVKVVVFNRIDIDFCLELLELYPWLGRSVPFYISLGNPALPGEKVTLQEHRQLLLDSYAILAEETLQEPRLERAIFLPQLHVLAWGNKQGV